MNRKIVAGIAVAIVGAAPLTAIGPEPARAAACVTIPAVAHRGGDERYVENTRNAFRSASNVGVGFWETDVRFTADNVPVIMHDPDVDRTTNGHGLVEDLTYDEIAQLRTADDQPVPTLAELMNDQAVDGAYFFVELKVMPTEAQWATFLAALNSRAGKGPRPALASFDVATLDALKVRAPSYTRALIQSVGDTDPATVTPHASILIKHHDAITSARIAKWVGAGLKVYAWTVDDTAEWERMTWYPVSGVVTNKPAAYLAWQRGRC